MADSLRVFLGGAVVVSVLERADGKKVKKVSDEEIANLTGLGYNPAVIARGFTTKQADSVRSTKAKSRWALQDTAEKVQARF